MVAEPIRDIQAALPEIKQRLDGAKAVVIGTHLNPDGDALGSALAFSHVLDQWGVAHDILCHNEVPDSLKFLPGAGRVSQTPKLANHDAALILDLEAMERLGSVRKFFDDVPHKIIIDHHIPYEAPGDMRVVSTAYPATCAILCDLFQGPSVTFNRDIATCLLTGILTDTGSFRYPNTTPHSLHQTALLLEHGANVSDVSEEVYMRKPLPAVRLLGYALANMKLSPDQRLAWCSIPLEAFQSLEASDQDSEGIVNELLSIKTVEIAALLREGKPGRIRASLRSRSHLDVAVVAQEFGGGGHRNAAGVSFDGGIGDAEKTLVEALASCLASS